MSQTLGTRQIPTGAHLEVGMRTSSSCMQERVLTLSELLRGLDVLRKRLARRTRGEEGAFPGFDVFELSSWQDDQENGPVRLIAALVSDTPSTQTVEYLATRCLHTDGICQSRGTDDAYFRARGTTIALPPLRTISPGSRAS